MSTPFYVSPQQAMADRAEYARKGIARGRSLVVLQYADGIVFVGENPSRALHKFSEIYDRIGFAAAGKYNEYENLRIGGVRYADLRGYTYDRDDVTARGLANVYAQTLGTIFSSAAEKPYEVELVVAEVGETPEGDQIYRLPHDGSIVDEHGSVAVGGNAEQISSFLDQRHRDGMSLAEALRWLAGAVPGHQRQRAGDPPPSGWRWRCWTVRVPEAQVQADRRASAGPAAGGGGCGHGGGDLGGGLRGGVIRPLDAEGCPGRELRPGHSVYRGRLVALWSPGRRVGRGCPPPSGSRPSRTARSACMPRSPEQLGVQSYGGQLGSIAVARARSSRPVTEMSSGMRRPRRRSAL